MCDEFVHRVRVCVCVRESRYAIELIFCVELCVVQRSVCCELCEIDAQIPNNNNKNWSYCRSLCMHEHNSTGWLFSASVTDNLTCSRWHDSHFKCNCSTSLYWTSIQMVCLVLCNASVYICFFFFFHYFIPFLFAIAMSRFAFMHRVAYEMENRMEQGDWMSECWMLVWSEIVITMHSLDWNTVFGLSFLCDGSGSFSMKYSTQMPQNHRQAG